MDYEDAYLSMKEKFLHLSKQLREKEDSWALERVKLRKQGKGGKNNNGIDDDHLNDSTVHHQRPQTAAPASTSTSQQQQPQSGVPPKKKLSPTSASSSTAKRPGSASGVLANKTNFNRTPSSGSTFRGVGFNKAKSPAKKPPILQQNNNNNTNQNNLAGSPPPPPPAAKTATMVNTSPTNQKVGQQQQQKVLLSAGTSPMNFQNTNENQQQSPPRGTNNSFAPSPRVTNSPRAPLPNQNNKNDISYTNVQLGALSQQLSPPSTYTAGNNNTTIFSTNHPLPPTATTIPPVHFEVVSLNSQYHQQQNNNTNNNFSSLYRNNINNASLLDHPGAKRPPESSMFWGINDNELPLDQTISGRTIAEINDRLRNQLQDCEIQLRRFNQETVMNRQVMDRQESQIQQLEHQLLLIVQERDAMAQRTSATTNSVANLQTQLESQLQQHETIRNSLEVQCRELRNKLINEIDQKEYLEREVSKAKSDVQEQLLTVSSLQSRVSVSEASLANQRNANETLLVEMKSLNDQLAAERRKTLAATRDAHLASHSRQRTEELELQMQSMRQEMQSIQSENLVLLEKVTKAQEEALKTAGQAVEAELAEAKSQANHWEHVALLQFRELEQNQKQRSQLRQELEETKADRDASALFLSRARSELAYANAKLDLCWPSHSKDTAGLNEDQLRNAYTKRFGKNNNINNNNLSNISGVNNNNNNNSVRYNNSNNTNHHQQQHNDSLLRGPVKEEELVGELQAANAVLMAENESLRLQNSLLIDRLEEAGIHFREKTKELETKVEKVVRHEQANVAHASRQADRIAFLESQVRNLRGSTVQSSFPIESLGVNETVFEVFVGQLLLENPPPIQSAQTSDCRAVPSVVAVVDFLIHESTVTHPVLESLHAAFDQTFAYRVNADAVLLHNIANGSIGVEIHEVRGTSHRAIARGEIGFKDLLRAAHQKRPSIRTHVTLKKLVPTTTDAESEIYGRIEVIITSRVPFPPLFVRLCDDHLESVANNSGLLLAENNNDNINSNRKQQKQGFLTNANNANGAISPGRTLFMPDPRDVSLAAVDPTISSSLFPRKNLHQHHHPNNNNVNTTNKILAAPGEDPIAILMKCNQINMKFLRVAVEFSEKEAPLLSWWYSFASSIGDSWVLPCVTEGKYDAPIEVLNTHAFSSPEELVSCLKKTIPVVAFDEGEEDPAKYWGVVSMTLSALLAAPTQILTLQLPVLSPDGHLRATLFAEASLASVNH